MKPETFLLHRGGRSEQMVKRCEYDAVVSELERLKARRDESNRIARAKVLLGRVLDEKFSSYLHGKLIKAIGKFLEEDDLQK